MGSVAKSFALILIIAISSLNLSPIIVKPTFAQSIPKPSIPEFSLKLSDSFSDVNVSYNPNPFSGNNNSIDPFTGENITSPASSMELLDVGNITLTIKNQPLVPYVDANNHTISLYYDVRFKGHYADEWTDVYNSGPFNPYLKTTNSDSTILTFKIGDPNGLTYLGTTPFYGIPSNGQVDFQVQAMIGYTYAYQSIQAYAPYTFSGEVSSWSNTQTITAGNYSISTSSSPTIPELSSLAIAPLCIFLLSISVILRHRKNSALSK